jgi:hypothetical protein
VCAEIAFGGRIAVRIDIKGIIRAGLHARLATDAAATVEVDNPIGSPKQRGRRADLNTRGLVAVIAAQHRKVARSIREFALLNVLDPRPVYPDGDIVLCLACHGAGVATDAAVLIDGETEAHDASF